MKYRHTFRVVLKFNDEYPAHLDDPVSARLEAEIENLIIMENTRCEVEWMESEEVSDGN